MKSFLIDRLFVVLCTVAAVAGVAMLALTLPSRFAVLPGIEGCRTLGDRDRAVTCVAERTVDGFSTSDPARSLAEVEDGVRGHPRLQAICHEAMHVASRELRPKDPAKLAERAGGATLTDCSSGFLHGTLELAITARGPAVALTTARTICGVIGSGANAEFREDNCYHSSGHAFRRIHDISKARTMCGDVSSEDAAEMECLTGVYMQDNYEVDGGRADPVERCEGASGTVDVTACWRYVAGDLEAAGTALPGVARACDSAPSELARAACAFGHGQSLRIPALERCDAHVSSLETWCQRGLFFRGIMNGDTAGSALKACTGVSGSAERCAVNLGAALANVERAQGAERSCPAEPRALRAPCARGERETELFPLA